MCLLKQSDGYHPSTPCPYCNPTGANNSEGCINNSDIDGDGIFYDFCPNCNWRENPVEIIYCPTCKRKLDDNNYCIKCLIKVTAQRIKVVPL